MGGDLLKAAGYHGSDGEVQRLLAEGAAPDTVAEGADSALCYAAMYGRLPSVRMLVEAGADVNHRGQYGRRPIHYAAQASAEIAAYLLDRGADLTRLTEGNEDALADALSTKDVPDVARLLVARGLPLDGLGRRRLLSWAAYCGRSDTVRALIALGADPNAPDRDGNLPLFAALGANDKEKSPTLRALLEGGAEPNVTSRFGEPLFLSACDVGDVELMRLLLRRGANPEVRSKSFGTTPLLEAAGRGHTDVARLLLDEATPPARLEEVDDGGETALMKAAYGGHLDAARLLLGRGARIDVLDKKGNSVLQHAAAGGNADLVTRLLDAGRPVDERNELGWTPLMQASLKCRPTAAMTLLLRGADPNARAQERGATAMMIAASVGADPIVGLLRQRGADETLADDAGRTVADYEREYLDKLREQYERD